MRMKTELENPTTAIKNGATNGSNETKNSGFDYYINALLQTSKDGTLNTGLLRC
jgi:hypothetical protein